MRNTIKNDYLVFDSDSYNAAPIVLRFVDETINYFWRPAGVEKPGTEVCFPLIGFLPDDTYWYGGKEYTMTMHGFAQDREFAVAGKGDSFITYELADDDFTYQRYPWHFCFQLTYALEKDSLCTVYRVENRDKKTLFFSVGGHPRYACPILEGSKFEDYCIKFVKPESTTNIVKSYGPIAEIDKHFGDDGKSIELDYSMFTEGCFCFHPCNSRIIYLSSDKDSRGLCVDLGGASHLQFWTCPTEPFLAIEPFFGSVSSLPPKEIDKDWIHKPGILHIEPGEVYTCAYSVKPFRK